MDQPNITRESFNRNIVAKTGDDWHDKTHGKMKLLLQIRKQLIRLNYLANYHMPINQVYREAEIIGLPRSQSQCFNHVKKMNFSEK